MSMFDELLASEVKYCGFVYIDSTDERPTLYHANVAAMMFDKKQLKATRALNPLFALENDKSLEMIVIQESLKMFAKKEGQTILEVPIRKLVFVAAQEKYIYVIADRSGAGKYYCHRFKLKNSTLSAEVSKRLTEVILQANGQPSRLPVDLDDQDDFEAKFGGDATAMHFSGLAVDVDSDDEEPVDDEADADVHIPIHRMLSTHRRPTVTVRRICVARGVLLLEFHPCVGLAGCQLAFLRSPRSVSSTSRRLRRPLFRASGHHPPSCIDSSLGRQLHTALGRCYAYCVSWRSAFWISLAVGFKSP
eukprot:m.61935 g.61935  ORF g.61935 m.61935 type:complete len:305 (+) comp49513_c0_seq1:220-1134(+)